jgi:hypothetical protein
MPASSTQPHIHQINHVAQTVPIQSPTPMSPARCSHKHDKDDSSSNSDDSSISEVHIRRTFRPSSMQNQPDTAQLPFYDIGWQNEQMDYVQPLYPPDTNPRRQSKVEKRCSKIYEQLSKKSWVQKGISKLVWNDDVTKLARTYRQFKIDLYYMLIHNPYTATILDRFGVVQLDCDIPWPHLKAAALFIFSKLEQTVKDEISNAYEDDPVSILLALDDKCTNINGTTVMDCREPDLNNQ